MVLSSGSVNFCRLEVVSWVPWYQAGGGKLEGLRASMPRVLETSTSLPTVVISEGK
jgi:hypothetical protein